jgi:uracil phosphoribosyltransferase
MQRVIELDHPLVAHHLTILRDHATPPALFRQQVHRLAMLLAVEATRDLPTRAQPIQTPLCPAEGHILAARIALVPILRAGLGLVEPILQLLPDAETWHLGMYRDEQTAEPVEYYCKLPEFNAPDVALVLDPMLATGGSIEAAIGSLKRWGVKDLRVLSVIAAQYGIDRIHKAHPEISIYVCKIDPELNANKFIVPGLGDAGDRIFNTRAS